MVRFTIVNDRACQDGGKATRLTADQYIPVQFRVLASGVPMSIRVQKTFEALFELEEIGGSSGTPYLPV